MSHSQRLCHSTGASAVCSCIHVHCAPCIDTRASHAGSIMLMRGRWHSRHPHALTGAGLTQTADG
eukprot:2039128-Alexandrium_andersonii.AAC.1